MLFRLSLAVVLVAGSACGRRDTGDDFEDPAAYESIEIDPPQATLTVALGGTATQAYVVNGVFEGKRTDITHLCALAIEVQYAAGGNDLFHVTMTSTFLSIDIYTTSIEAMLGVADWDAITTSSAGEQLAINVEGLAQATASRPATAIHRASRTACCSASSCGSARSQRTS